MTYEYQGPGAACREKRWQQTGPEELWGAEDVWSEGNAQSGRGSECCVSQQECTVRETGRPQLSTPAILIYFLHKPRVISSSQAPAVSGRVQRGTKEFLMARSVNKVILVGHVGKDPEVKYTPSGTAVANFSIATNDRFKDKDGQWQDRTEWHRVVAWQRTAEIVGEYVKKGSNVYVEGKLQTRSWDDKETGQKKYMTEIWVNDLVLLGGRGAEDGGGRTRSASAGFDQRVPEPAGAPAQPGEITDDDIPF